jgi:hypothetical protein
MQRLSLQDFRARVRAFHGQSFQTGARKRGFTLHVQPSGLEFAVSSSGKTRRHDWADVERVLERYEECRAFNPSRYTDVTFNASYVLAVLHRMLEDGGNEGGRT